MSQEDQNKELYATADKFINLANELVQSGQSGIVGPAFRFAAARFSAFEASMRTANLAEDQEREFTLFADEFSRMLRINIEDYVRVQSQK